MEYTDLRPGKKIMYNGDPYEVVSAEFSRKQQRKAVVKASLRNLVTGRALPVTFQGSDVIDEVQLETKSCQFLFRTGSDLTFMDMDSFDQFALGEDQVGPAVRYLAEGADVEIVLFKGKPISVNVGKKVELKVVDSPPGVRGDTANAATKPAKLETGFTLQVPLFVNEGDVIRVNSETGEYVERVK
jgi:elongation factor P